MIRHVLHIISIWIVVLPLVAGLINYRGLNEDSKWIFFLTVVAVPPQVMTYFFNFTEEKWLNITYNLYTPVEFYLLFFLFKPKYETRGSRLTHLSTAFLYAALSIFFVVRFDIGKQFISYWVCANNLFYIFWIMLFLKEQYHSDSFLIRKENPFAWYILALIIYAP